MPSDGSKCTEEEAVNGIESGGSNKITFPQDGGQAFGKRCDWAAPPVWSGEKCEQITLNVKGICDEIPYADPHAHIPACPHPGSSSSPNPGGSGTKTGSTSVHKASTSVHKASTGSNHKTVNNMSPRASTASPLPAIQSCPTANVSVKSLRFDNLSFSKDRQPLSFLVHLRVLVKL